MHGFAQLILFSALFTSSRPYFLHGFDGYPHLRYDYHDDPAPPHPLDEPPPLHPLPPPPHHVHQLHPLVYRAPPQAVVVVPVRGVFPPFIERIVQRIQTFWSVYNPPELLTRPPPTDPPTTKRPRIKTTTSTAASTLLATTEASTSEPPSDVTSSEDATTKVSTLVVFEVPPSSPASPGAASGAEPAELQFITPERASALGQKEAYLRFLQTGKVPPFLQPDNFNEMDPEDEMYA